MARKTLDLSLLERSYLWQYLRDWYCAYWLAISETYILTKSLLKRWHPVVLKCEHRQYEQTLFQVFGGAGAALTILGIARLLSNYRSVGGYVFEIRQTVPLHVQCFNFVIAFVGLWLLLEWVQFRKGKLSLLRVVLRGYGLPLYALLIASAVFSLFMETVNTAHHFWIYTNWPLPDWQLAGIPVMVLVTWPLGRQR